MSWLGALYCAPLTVKRLIELDQLPDLHALTDLLAPPKGEVPDVAVVLPGLAGYDALLEGVQ